MDEHTLPATRTLETARLLLRPLELVDAGQVQPLFAQWNVVKFLNDKVKWPFPPDGAYTYYRDVALPAIERGDEWHWTLRLKTDPTKIIGGIGLMKGDNNRGFWLGVPWHRQGLMTEATVAVTDFWFNELGFSILRVPKAIANEGSRKISESSGMRIVGVEERGYVGGRLPSEIWEITADEWRRNRNQK